MSRESDEKKDGEGKMRVDAYQTYRPDCLTQLDNSVGGMRPGQLILLGGPAKSSKSQLALALAARWSETGPVAFVSDDAEPAELS